METRKILCFLSSLLMISSVNGSEILSNQTSGVRWQAGVDGVEIEWSPDGGFNRIYSSFYQPVGIADRRGISKAYIIAEEKAKAMIIRFLNQNVSSNRLVRQVESDSEAALQKNGESESFSKETRRNMVETLTEVTSSYASGNLRGVIILEKGYDEERSEVWVKVGISKKTMNAAQNLSDALTAPAQNNSTKNPHSGTMKQGSEVRKTNQANW